MVAEKKEVVDRTLRGSVVRVTVREGEREWVQEVPKGVSVSTVRRIVAGLVGWKPTQVGMEVEHGEGGMIGLWDTREFECFGVEKEAVLLVSKT